MSTRRATVALIMANYNHARYLRTSLSGLCEQTRPADEIIVVDDGSTDNSVEIIEDYAGRHPNVRLLRNEKNRGVQYSISRALETCKSDYIALLAADDRILSQFVEKSMSMLEKYPSAGLCFSTYALMDAETDEIHDCSTDPAHRGAFELQRYLEYMSPGDYRKQLRGGIIWMSSNTVILKKEAFYEAGGFLAKLRWHTDWFVNTTVALRYGACVVPEVLSAIRVRTKDSFSGTAYENVREQRKVISSVIRTIYRPRYWDIGLAFLRYPVLLTPLDQQVVPALLGSPLGWPFIPRYLSYLRNASIGISPTDSWRTKLPTRIFLFRNRIAPQLDAQAGTRPSELTVSVVMANYNHAHYLRESLSALCNQTHPPDELVVVDDGSTDGSLAVLAEFARKHSFIRVLCNDGNRGQLYSINRALREARGVYVNWAAADDRVAPTFLEKTLSCIARHPGVGVCQTEYALFYESGGPFVAQSTISNVFNFKRMPEYMAPWRYREWLKDEIVWLTTNGALVRRDVLLEMGAYHSEMEWHADWFSAQVAALRYGICIVPEPLAALRVQTNSYSMDGMLDPEKQNPVLDAIFDRLNDPRFRDIRRDFHKYSRVISALSPSVYQYLARRPTRWSYLIRHSWWRFWRFVSYDWSVRFSVRLSHYSWKVIYQKSREIWSKHRSYLTEILLHSGSGMINVLLRGCVKARSMLRRILLPLSVASQPVRPLYQRVMNWIESRAPGRAKNAFRWLRRQIAFLFSRQV